VSLLGRIKNFANTVKRFNEILSMIKMYDKETEEGAPNVATN
jgi:hypothetical protein